MNLFSNIKRSIYAPAFYREILSRPTKESFKYFALLALCLSVLSTLIVSVKILPDVNAFTSQIGPKVLKLYPAELEIKIQKGTATANVDQPYFIALPASDPELNPVGKRSDIKNLLVIDTKEPFSEERFREFKTAALLTGDSLVVQNNSSKLTIQSLQTAPDAVINHAWVESILTKFTPFLKALPYLLIPVFLIIFYLSFIGKLVYALFLALLVMLIARVRHITYGYKAAYRVTLHALTLGLIYGYVLTTLWSGFAFPFATTVFTLLVVILNLRPEPASSRVSTPAPTQ